ncbi:MAG: amino acid ABC transporter permease [Deltaproteobacteria bacterium]|jgi:general L-amino acid transport system permease protein|nr:amino acid ABC transporter permease [Deltaproteobacteria bacterium]MBT7204676.1 amino acid ABC transporter permease [Deltaproteobacteria bacterium]
MAERASATSVLNNPQFRAILYQLIMASLLIYLGWSIVENTIANMEERGIRAGFGFLQETAGFSITMSLVPYEPGDTYGRVFVVGLLNTLLVAGVGVILATLVGFLVGVMRLSQNWVVSRLANIYVEIFRNIPLLLQILFWYTAVLKPLPGPRQVFERNTEIYFGISNRGITGPEFVLLEDFSFTTWTILLGILFTIGIHRWAKQRQATTGDQFPILFAGLVLVVGLPILMFLLSGAPIEFTPAKMGRFNLAGGITIIPEFLAILLSLVLYTASFIAEIVRAGIQAVNYGQTEASRALGLRHSTTLRLVVIPQAMRIIIPPLTSQYLNLTKNSSLAAAIAYPDLISTFAGTALNQNGQALETLAITMTVYLSLSLLTSAFMNWFNSRVALVER